MKFDRKLDSKQLETAFVGGLTKEYMIEYGAETLYERAVPKIEDGFKPVHRKVIYIMHQMNAVEGKPHKKVARISGEVMGKLHPHGGASIDSVIVSLAHTRYQIIDPQGNFGSRTTANAASRYIEARLSKFGTMICDRLNIAPMVPNFDGLEQEPLFIPTSIPLILLNGTPTGIALGLRVGMPSHNIGQTVDALVHLLEDKAANEDTFLAILDRPDFRDCVILNTRSELRQIYKTGYGMINFGPKYEYKVDGEGIILSITGLPPTLNASNVIDKIKETFQKEGLIDYVKESIYSVSTINGSRPIDSVHIKAGNKKLLEEQILPYFYSNFFVNLHAVEIEGGISRVPAYSFFRMANKWIEYQKVFKKQELEAILKKKDYELRINSARLDILGDKDKTDKLINMIRSKRYETNEVMQQEVARYFKLDEDQTENLCSSQLRTLSNANVSLLADKIDRLKDEIQSLQKKLKNISLCLVEDLQKLKETFGDENETVFSEEYQAKGEGIRGKATIIGISEGGRVYFENCPRSVPASNIQSITSGGVVIEKNGIVHPYSLSTLVGKLGHSCAGFVSYDYDYALVFDDQGKAILLDLTYRKNSRKPAMRDIGEIKRVVGIKKGDTLYVTKYKYPVLDIVVDSQFITKFSRRIGSVGTSLYLGHKNDVDFFIVPKGAQVIDASGTELNSAIIKRKLQKEEELCVLPLSTLARKGGKIFVVKGMDVKKYLSNLV